MFIYSVETIISAILIALLIIIKLYWSIKDWWKYKDCKHEKYYENMSCNAICSNCRKDLGFIGSWKDKLKEGKQ